MKNIKIWVILFVILSALLYFLVIKSDDSIDYKYTVFNNKSINIDQPLVNEQPTNEPISDWNTDYFSDEFGDVTNNKFMFALVDGTFSNSATNNSYLSVQITINKDKKIGIFLHEYHRDSSPVTIIGGLRLKLKNNKTNKSYRIHYARKWNDKGGILINNIDIINFLKESNGLVHFYIADDYSSVYNFSVNADYFSDTLKTILK